MRTRNLAVGLVLALTAAACGTDSPVVEQQFGLIHQGDAVTLQVLSYNHEPDSTVGYGFTMAMAMNTRMDFPDLGGSGDMSMGMSLDGGIEYDIAPGPQPGSMELTMRSDFSEFDVDYFTVDGRSMANQLTPSDLAALGDQNALPEITVVVSESGEILDLQYGGTAMPKDFLSGFGSGGFSDPTGMSLAGLFGPEMPAEEVGVGAEWTVDNSQEVPFLGTMAASTHYWITEEKEFKGRDVLVIVSSSTIEDMEIDLLEMMESMMSMDSASLEAMGMDRNELAEAQRAMFDGMEMTMRFSYDKINGTTYFDPAEGSVLWSSTDALMTGSMDMSTPEGDGTMTFDMTMDMEMLRADEGLGT